MMDTHPQPGPQRHRGGGPGKFTKIPALPTTPTARFIQCSRRGDGAEQERFEEIIDDVKAKKGVKQDVELDTEDMRTWWFCSRSSTRREGRGLPPGSKVQLMEAVKAVFRSWDNHTRQRLPPHERDSLRLGHRRQRQSMVCSATPATIRHAWPSPHTPPPARVALFGEYLMQPRARTVVAGVRTPSPSHNDA